MQQEFDLAGIPIQIIVDRADQKPLVSASWPHRGGVNEDENAFESKNFSQKQCGRFNSSDWASHVGHFL